MPSANDLYLQVMSTLQKMNPQLALVVFLKKQSLSLMRGIQISDDIKMKSMQILFNAAALIESKDQSHDLLNQLVKEINTSKNELDENDKKYINDSKCYIENALSYPDSKNNLKINHNGKPWLMLNKKSLSQRKSMGLNKPETDMPGSGLIPGVGVSTTRI